MKNPVAKNARKFNKAAVMRDRTKYQRKAKYANRYFDAARLI